MKKGEIESKSPYEVNVEKDKKYLWCSCGKSKKQPFCDNSHKGSEFIPVVFKAINTEKIFFCGCKQTEKPPLCDNSHKKL